MQGTVIGGIDPAIKVLLHCDATPFVDSSKWARTITNTGSVAVDGTNKVFGAGSAAMGTNKALTFADSSDLELLDQDFTIDMWVRSTSSTTGAFLSKNVPASGSPPIGPVTISQGFNNRTLGVAFSVAGTTPAEYSLASASESLTVNTWHHVAATRKGATGYAFLDGTLYGTAALGTASLVNNSYDWALGKLGGALNVTTYMQGQIDEFRMIIGKCVWTSSFTPPTKAYRP